MNMMKLLDKNVIRFDNFEDAVEYMHGKYSTNSISFDIDKMKSSSYNINADGMEYYAVTFNNFFNTRDNNMCSIMEVPNSEETEAVLVCIINAKKHTQAANRNQLRVYYDHNNHLMALVNDELYHDVLKGTFEVLIATFDTNKIPGWYNYYDTLINNIEIDPKYKVL